jgi:FAD dependent oxidoreductase/FAD binding domain
MSVLERRSIEDDPIQRRQFVQYSAAGVALAAASTGLTQANALLQPGRVPTKGPVTTECDILVVGGGTAGTIAAIQAGRLGFKTLIVERNSQLGGTTTTAGVSFPGLFDAWGRQIIAGIGWELVRESVALDGGTLPDFSKVPDRHWENQVRVNQFLYALLAEEKCEQAGVQIAYYESPQAIAEAPDGWQVDCVGFGTQRRVLCKQIIDCTGGAEVVGMLNLPRLSGDQTQPGSLLFKLDTANSPGRPNGPGSGLLDSLYIHGADSANSRTVTAANLKGRKSILEKARKENKRLMHLQPEVGFRESHGIEGETVITVDDYTSGRVFEDAVCYAFYPVDLHTRSGVKPKPLAKGTVPTVPLRALVPKDSRNIMVAGRCVSSDRLANSGLRVQATCMAMGQAAGATAALAAQTNATPLAVPLKDIRRVLHEHGATIPTVQSR